MSIPIVVPHPVQYDSMGRAIVPRFGDVIDKWCAHAGPGGWIMRAACVGHDPELWQPNKTKAGTYSVEERHRFEQARTVCRGCLVKEECLSHAVEHQEVGMWGGLTEVEREELRRRNKISKGRQ